MHAPFKYGKTSHIWSVQALCRGPGGFLEARPGPGGDREQGRLPVTPVRSEKFNACILVFCARAAAAAVACCSHRGCGAGEPSDPCRPLRACMVVFNCCAQHIEPRWRWHSHPCVSSPGPPACAAGALKRGRRWISAPNQCTPGVASRLPGKPQRLAPRLTSLSPLPPSMHGQWASTCLHGGADAAAPVHGKRNDTAR